MYTFFDNGTTCHAKLASFSDWITDLLDKENTIGLIFMDFRKGFDTAPCGKLPAKEEAGEMSRKPERLLRNEQQAEMRTDCINREDIASGGGYAQRCPETGLDTVLSTVPSNGLGEGKRDFVDSTGLRTSSLQGVAVLYPQDLGLG